MCVTNTTNRRPQALSLASHVTPSHPSPLTQRLFGPLMPAAHGVGPSEVPAGHGTKSTCGAALNLNGFPCPSGRIVPTAQQDEKPKPKRRRKPQKPGKTAKMNDRHFVVHNYHDHADDEDETEIDHEDHEGPQQRRRGGVAVAFPLKLHAVLDQVEADGLAHIVSWQQHGRCFVVHKPKEFVDLIMPRYFRQTKLTSFQRQLNLYGFCRLTRGRDSGGYYHELFLRGKTYLCKRMTRTKVKGTGFKAASSPEQEPDFYTMPPVLVTPPASSDEEYSAASDESRSVMHSACSSQASASMVPSAVFSLQNERNALFSFMASRNETNSMCPPPFSYGMATTPQPPPPVMQSYQTFAASPMAASQPTEADRVLDEAVDELFLQDAAQESDTIMDFVKVWDPSNFGGETALEDDSQLGLLLDKLLEG